MIDIIELSRSLDETSPCGENTGRSSTFNDMMKAMKGEPERGIGKFIIEAVEPDWKTVREKALQLFGSTRDLQVATSLCAALLHTDGFVGLRDGLLLVGKLLENLWDCIYPKLDPSDDDGNPAFRRGNILLYLTDPKFLRSLKKQPLLITKVVGKFSLNDIQQTQNYKNSTVNEEKRQYQLVEAAFREAIDSNTLLDISNTLNMCRKNIGIINKLFQERVGHANAPNFAALQEVIETAFKLISERIPPHVEEQPKNNLVETQAAMVASPVDATIVSSVAISGREDPMHIQNRDDVLNAIDRICEYYAHNEPSSPVPLILGRARNLVNKDFIEILQDLNPDSTAQVEKLLFGLKGK